MISTQLLNYLPFVVINSVFLHSSFAEVKFVKPDGKKDLAHFAKMKNEPKRTQFFGCPIPFKAQKRRFSTNFGTPFYAKRTQWYV